MTNINTNISLADPAELTDEYFLIIEQVEPEGTLVEEEDAAKLVDDIYKTSICDESYEIPICGGSITANARPDEPTEEEVQEAVEELQIPDCEDADGSFETQVKIYRSHQEEDYNLVIEGGEETLRVIVQEPKTITLNVKLQNSVEIGYPYVGNVQAVWLGEVYNSLGNINPPSITVSGNVLSWAGNVTGTITISFNTIYDLIDIYAYPPDEDEDGNYVDLLAFYHYEVYTETIEEIVPDDNLTAAELQQLCEEWGGGIVTVPPTTNSDCYSLAIHRTRCDCSGKIESSDEVRTEATCPEEQSSGQVGNTKETTSYIDCDESDRVNDPEYYEENCCTPPPFPLPKCKTKITITPSDGTLSQNDIDHYTALYGSAVRFIPVSPDEGYCGIHRTIQDVDSLNCCDEVEPIEPDPNNPTEIVSGGSRIIKVLKGQLPMTWQVNGTFVFQNGFNYYVGGREVTVTASDPACANCHITVEDGCSDLNITLPNTSATLLELTVPDPNLPIDSGVTYVTVSGGLAHYILTTQGEYTHFSNGLKEITISSPGTVAVYVDQEQKCEGDFTVTVTDACAEVASVTIAIKDIDLGIACATHSTAYAAMCSVTEFTAPAWFTYTDMGTVQTYDAGWNYTCASPITNGTWVVLFGSTPYLTHVSAPFGVAPNQVITITRRSYNGRVFISAPCDECL